MLGQFFSHLITLRSRILSVRAQNAEVERAQGKSSTLRIAHPPILAAIQHNSSGIMYYINLIYMSGDCKIQFSHRKQQEWQNGRGSAQPNITEVPESAQASAERVSMAGINS